MDAYSEEQFRAAVAAARTYGAVARLLGLVPGGSATRRVRRDIERWGVDDSHIREYLRHRGRRTWTDEDLEAAVGASSSYREVRERLGLKDPSTLMAIRIRIAELGIDDEHLRAAVRAQRTSAARRRRAGSPPDGVDDVPDLRRNWTDDDLRAAVAAATSLHQVFGNLGLTVGGSQWQVVRERIIELGLDTSHFAPRAARTGRTRSWTDEELQVAVADARSVAAVLRSLGVTGGGAQQTVVKRIRELRLDTDHMRGQGWSKGRTFPRRYRRSLDEILIENSTFRDSKHLKTRLVEEGILSWRCDECGLSEWRGRHLTLQLDHINGDRRDNRLENLRLLCPNCHTQTDTYCGKNIGRYDR